MDIHSLLDVVAIFGGDLEVPRLTQLPNWLKMAIPIQLLLWSLVTHFGFCPSGLDSCPLSLSLFLLFGA
jgi:hypothetical protein